MTNWTEVSPIMLCCGEGVFPYLERRKKVLEKAGVGLHEAFFHFISMNGRVGFWSPLRWTKLETHVEVATGFRFRQKDFRPTLAQMCKRAGAPIEVMSEVLRHSSSKITEQYYARIRPESAFSQGRAAWQARKPLS